MAKTLIEFTDNGQDFLYWTVDEAGKVIKSRPFQSDVWRGLQVKNLSALKRGAVVEFSHHGRHGCISHLVKYVTPLAPIDISVRHDGIAGYVTSSVHGRKVSCTHSDKYAVERLAEKLFPGLSTTIVRVPCTPTGRLHSKWRIAAEEV